MLSDDFRKRALDCPYLRRAKALISMGQDPLEVLQETALALSKGMSDVTELAVDAEKRACPRPAMHF